MKREVKMSMGQKAFFLYAFIIVVILGFVIYTYFSFNQVRSSNEYLYNNYVKAISKLSELKYIVKASDAYITDWFLTEKDTSASEYKAYFRLVDSNYYDLKGLMWVIVDYWPKDMQNIYYQILDKTDTLILRQKLLLGQFESYQAFSNTKLLMIALAQLQEGGRIKALEQIIISDIDRLYTQLTGISQGYISSINKMMMTYRRTIVFGVFLFLILLSIGVFAFVNNILSNVKKVNDISYRLAKGELVSIPWSSRQDELGIFYQNLRSINEYLKHASEFASNLAKNNFECDFKPASKNDALGNAMMRLRDNLIQAQKEAELRRIENQQRQWSSQGIAEFAEILREHSNDLDDLSQAVIAELVNYTIANVGGIYIIEDEDPENVYIELRAFYAYDRHKFVEKRFKPGETLVGQCYLEGQTIYMNDVPEDYMKIVSGLGSDKPRSILIVPLIVNEKIMGIVELASFEEFEPYQIEFVEKIGESIASSISTVKINLRTQRLLQEMAEKTSKLEAREEEIRKEVEKKERTIQELRKSLDEQHRKLEQVLEQRNQLELELKHLTIKYEQMIREKDMELGNILLAINNTIGFYVLSYSGDFIEANPLYLSFLKTTKDDIIGSKHQRFVGVDFVNSGNYKKIWDDLKLGKSVKTSVQYMVEGKSRYVNEVFTPVLNEQGSLEKVIVFSFVES